MIYVILQRIAIKFMIVHQTGTLNLTSLVISLC